MTLKKATLDMQTGEVTREETIPEITVKPPDAKETPTLTEKLKDFAPRKTRQPRAKRAPKGKQIDANLISKLAPTIVATFAATYSRQLIQDPYKVCAPSQQEVLTIVSPLFNILSRQVEITGQASENVIDLITCAIASIIFGTRAYVTYATIKENEQNGTIPTTNESVNAKGFEKASNSRNESGGDSEEDYRNIRASEQVSTNGGNDSTDDSTIDSSDTRRDAEIFSELFKKDVNGRIRLGHLPPRIQD